MAAAAAASVMGVQLLFGSIAYNFYFAFVVEVFSCKGVVEVNRYAIIFYHQYDTIDNSTLGSFQILDGRVSSYALANEDRKHLLRRA